MEETLIRAVASFPVIYDASLFAYRDTNKKNHAWMKVSEIVGVPVEEVKAKWKNLRDTYTRKKRLEQTGRSDKKKKPWRYMRVMDFLEPAAEHRSVLLNTIPNKIEDDEPDDDSGTEPASTSTGTSMSSPGIQPFVVKRKRTGTLDLLERYLATKDAREKDKDEPQLDEVDLFLRSLAPAIRRLPASKQSLVKLQIQKILHDAEFGQSSFPQMASVSPSNQLLLQCSVVKPS